MKASLVYTKNMADHAQFSAQILAILVYPQQFCNCTLYLNYLVIFIFLYFFIQDEETSYETGGGTIEEIAKIEEQINNLKLKIQELENEKEKLESELPQPKQSQTIATPGTKYRTIKGIILPEGYEWKTESVNEGNNFFHDYFIAVKISENPAPAPASKTLAGPGQVYTKSEVDNYILPDNHDWYYLGKQKWQVILRGSRGGKYKSKPNSIDNYTVEELKERAAKRKINIKGMKKKEIIDKLRGKNK